MRVLADLQLHSRFSRAVSPQMVVPVISSWAAKKGIGLVATGDWTHPLWLRELEVNLEEAGEGVYKAKDAPEGSPLFLLSTEVSSIYSQGGKVRKIHTLIFAPNFEVAGKINSELSLRGANLLSDGRPIVGLSAKAVAEIALGVEPKCLIIPAHAWTPHFSIFGSVSGFDSIAECFQELSPEIYAIETGLSCYDRKTEVLTEAGWKKVSEVKYKDKICTLNIDTDEIEFQKPRRIFAYNYKGKMYKLRTKRVNLFVTPNHKLLVSHCDFRKPPEFRLKEARSLFKKSKRFKKNGLWNAKNERYFVLPAVRIKHGSRFYSGFRKKKGRRFSMKSWLKFFGFWIAEGWTTKGGDGDYNVCISNNDKRLLSEMSQILESFGYNVLQRNNVIRIRDYQLYFYLKQFGKAADKFVPQEIKSLSKELLEIFFEYYIKGDGHVYGRTSRGLSATTISVRLRDDLQEIALKIGISAYYKLGYKKGTSFHGPLYKDRIYKQSADSWIVYFIRKNIHTTSPSTIKKYNYTESWVDFEGKVFCVSVPNQVIYVRRNGIPVWCGNSDPAMNWRIEDLKERRIVSFSDAHSPPKITGEGPDKIAYTIEFYPEEGKYHYTGHRNCNVVYSPNQTRKLGTVCPVCGRPLTVGVMSRVEALAKADIETKSEKDEFGVRWIYDKEKERPPYVMVVPLLEILSEAMGAGVGTQTVLSVYEQLTSSLGSEFKVLLESHLADIERVAGAKVAEAVAKVRSGDISIEPGYDGVFGKVKIWKEEEGAEDEIEQETLF
ncbi:MAG: PHP domain-containing protein [Candidatus Curtissbacteria bacterium GW2011_GWC1_44_33]|uniref:PHP domain-containing protein n=1 Tax=Candidatus Curtissbacteria bacterium GW2011_GWC1_44_33 TaxID=1618413 RepID=A0A0G1J7T4_9BACT|nr:MAG: PHP domain-containing protein [Candidatus Curtissbacteria bacterium GW2011_GWC1_44_33]